jgi:hypothetical protein
MTMIVIFVCSMIHSRVIGFDFIPSVNDFVGIYHQHKTRYGMFNRLGYFDELYTDSGTSISGLVHRSIIPKVNTPIFQLHGGMLILGQFEKGGRFVPSEQSLIVSFAKYRRNFTDPIIWNLPGRYEPRTVFDAFFPNLTNRTMKLPEGYSNLYPSELIHFSRTDVPRRQTHKFQLDTQTFMAIYQPTSFPKLSTSSPSHDFLIGKLDEHGDFCVSCRAANHEVVKNQYQILNQPKSKPTPVYELRSGMLIPGCLNTDGKFIPKPGGTITAFSDYQFQPTDPIIWNLPGRFVPITPP